jgi:hypothetical protein
MTKKRPRVHLEDDEWCTIAWVGQHEECCECGLKHITDYRVVDGKLQFKARRIKS